MRSKLILCVVLGLAPAIYAKDPKPYQTGKLIQMNSVQCGMSGKGTQNIAGEMLDTDSTRQKTQELLCQEYVVQSERVIYRIRPRDQKHPVLLAVGGQAQFRLQEDKMLLRVEDLDDPYRNNPDHNKKEREYKVVSMTPISDSSTADATHFHLNHLQ
jgi:hypothetical protein